MERGRSGENVERRSESAVPESSRPPCRFFLLGKCKFGDSCTFSHDPRGRIPVCSFFEKNGSCRYGEDCKFLHGKQNESTAETEGATASEAGGSGSTDSTPAVQLDPGDNCGICLENIPASGKRFGLLNCDHVYCLECLRKWRKSKGPQKDISRTCPECRKVSFFLVPSKEHLKGKEKMKAMQEYKKGLSKLPCKYHKPDGSTTCPFGWRCFYAHLDEHGVDVKDRAPPSGAGAGRRTSSYPRNNAGRSVGRSGVGGGVNNGTRGAMIAGGDPGFRQNEIEMWEEEALAQFRESPMPLQQGHGSHMSAVILRLEQLMLEIGGP